MKTIIILLFSIIATLELFAQISPTPPDFSCDIDVFSESFENGLPPDWSNLEPDSAKLAHFNEGWVRDRDTTFSSGTGPDMAQDGEYYIYCDGSGPIGRGDTATTISPVINLGPGFRPAMTFYLNMFGRSGSFYVNVISGGNSTQVLTPVSGNVDGGIHAMSEWEEVYINLNPWKNQSIQIEFVTVKPSNGYNGDIAIDNIVICSSSNPIPTLSEWGLIILTLVLFIFGIVAIKEQSNSKSLITKYL